MSVIFWNGIIMRLKCSLKIHDVKLWKLGESRNKITTNGKSHPQNFMFKAKPIVEGILYAVIVISENLIPQRVRMEIQHDIHRFWATQEAPRFSSSSLKRIKVYHDKLSVLDNTILYGKRSPNQIEQMCYGWSSHWAARRAICKAIGSFAIYGRYIKVL